MSFPIFFITGNAIVFPTALALIPFFFLVVMHISSAPVSQEELLEKVYARLDPESQRSAFLSIGNPHGEMLFVLGQGEISCYRFVFRPKSFISRLRLFDEASEMSVERIPKNQLLHITYLKKNIVLRGRYAFDIEFQNGGGSRELIRAWGIFRVSTGASEVPEQFARLAKSRYPDIFEETG